MDLGAFPEELLLHVFSLIDDGLTVLDVLPLVCKRWNRLSRDSHAWTGVAVDCRLPDDQGAGDRRDEDHARVLLHAPALSVLNLDGQLSPRVSSALRRNDRVVVLDELVVSWKDAALSAVLLELVWRSRRQLRRVNQFRLVNDLVVDGQRSVVGVVSQLRNVGSLDLYVPDDCRYDAELASATFARLRSIRVNLARRSECKPPVLALVTDLLHASAATLCQLTLSTTGMALPAELEDCVTRCRNLERLNAPLRDTCLAALRGLRRLREMALFLHPHQPAETDADAVACATDALRLCRELPDLRLARLYVYCYQAGEETHRQCAHLVDAMRAERPELAVTFHLI